MEINNRHLTYCTNIHAGGDWAETFDSIQENLPALKQSVSPNKIMGLGLRLSNKASLELGEKDNLVQFKKWLDQEECYVFTMNGFPYGNFHGEPVKDKVHAPDWTTEDRVKYTQRLFGQLAFLAPANMEAGISTSPISYKHWYSTEASKTIAFRTGARNMVRIADYLNRLEKETGRYMHLDVEPEPDGFLENTTEVLTFYKDYLIPEALVFFNNSGKTEIEITALVKRYITLCYDVCHYALAFEEPEFTFEQMQKAGISIGKIQVSAALKIVYDDNHIDIIWKTLEEFNEPVYLHQVTEEKAGKIVTYNDLPLVLDKKSPFTELRSHFHVPIFLEDYGVLKSTQDQILKVLALLQTNHVSNHLEVETYTWDVLPQALKLPLVDSIARELNWMKSRL
ncbi:xylose isomerase [Croceivirga radicis]|uniref:Xylose isomerase n=1 Tax=Croceivirga radicis TaxID=1929488 RepID=A0A1V6LR50_9FLAO|nr:metabolite traffic protein EboE [Croceivirga radicis]OQD42671.1 xylose isomerase [Croceivirga radicis]